MPEQIVNLFEGEAKCRDFQICLLEHKEHIFVQYCTYWAKRWVCKWRIPIPIKYIEKIITALAASIGKKVLVLDEGEYNYVIRVLREHFDNLKIKLQEDYTTINEIDANICNSIISKLTALQDEEPE